ncbi:glycosyl transferase family 2 [Rhodococcus wratislaviensis]|uniref:glycosyltransferase family 2 protein n=2 Tax=Rhodococcus wratislaviensis TaxID=44752 RepID=UPI000E257EA2|nr:glycosyltransferase family A protein [Rhodococcus wratislaviensis]REE73189.1 glycosyl transferase family 2 [Rhodococcus wratislaviensis]
MDPAAPALTLRPALDSPERPDWDGAVWIGEVWVGAIEDADRAGRAAGIPVRCRLAGAEGYGRARLLVRADGRPLGFVEIEVSESSVNFGELRRRVAGLRVTEPDRPVRAGPARVAEGNAVPVTVVVCTRDRVSMLRAALRSVLAVDYPSFDVLVVDNAPRTDATRQYVLGLADPRVRLIREPLPGLSRARNTGLSAATGDIVAYTDDDVVVDRHWLSALVDGFGRGPSVSCVSGMVPAGEIRTPAQAYFDRRVGWSDSTDARVFDWAKPPADVPLFPFTVRCYGTGANFAVERDVVRRLGGFDEALGAGAPTGGGEDIDMFFRILRSGRQLVHDPAAIVWHRHRDDSEGLLVQSRGYGLGLGAWLAKIAGDPEMATLAATTAARRGGALVRHLRASSKETAPPADLAEFLPAGLGSTTVRSIMKGPWAYRSARREGRSPAPLRKRTPQQPTAVPHHPMVEP